MDNRGLTDYCWFLWMIFHDDGLLWMIIIWISLWLMMDDHGWLWMIMDDYGWLWMIDDDKYWWMIVDYYDGSLWWIDDAWSIMDDWWLWIIMDLSRFILSDLNAHHRRPSHAYHIRSRPPEFELWSGFHIIHSYYLNWPLLKS
jgi:hypothetical protein